MANISNLNASRIAHVAQSENLDQATRMGILDKIIDFFRGGVKREAIEMLFNSITLLKSGGPSNNEYEDSSDLQGGDPHEAGANTISELQRLNLFHELRSLALPEHQDQFRYDLRENPSGTIECQISVGDFKIYENNEIHYSCDARETSKILSAKFRMDLEESIKKEDPVMLLKTLNDVSILIRREQSAEFKDSTKPIGADDLEPFSFKKMDEIFHPLPEDVKNILFSKATGDFGNRIRGILKFSEDALGRAGQHTSVRVPFNQGIDSPISGVVLDDQTTAERALFATPIRLETKLTELIMLCMKQPEAHTPISGLDPVFIKIPDEDPYKSMPKLSRAEVKTYSDLTEAETRALNIIGIPESILSLL